jgi:dCMP deaminase
MNQSKWHSRFLNLAELVAGWSKDPSTKVGAVITDNQNRVISLGYNGFARDVEDSEERLNTRLLKYEFVIHAEQNAILFANRDLEDCNIYTYPFQPCNKCASLIVQAGIKRVFSYSASEEHLKRWDQSFKISRSIMKEGGVQYYEYPQITEES